jgi:uncharacterized membrane protein YhaH (DUF805 family)
LNDISAATLTDFSQPASDKACYQPTLLSVDGRLGRVRYLAYSTALALAFAVVVGLIASILFKINPDYVGLAMVLYLPAMFAAFVIAKRRLNDLDVSGWVSLLMLVPLVNLGLSLWMMFARGSAGANNFGPPPAPNSTRVVVLAWVVTLLACCVTVMVCFIMLAVYTRGFHG